MGRLLELELEELKPENLQVNQKESLREPEPERQLVNEMERSLKLGQQQELNPEWQQVT